MTERDGLTPSEHGSSAIGCADAEKQWPHNICSGPIEYHKANNYDGFVLCDAMHGIPTFGSVVDASKPSIRGQHVRVFNYPKQTEAIAAQLVLRWNSHDALVAALRDLLAVTCPYRGKRSTDAELDAREKAVAILASLQREALAETPSSVDGVDTKEVS